MTILEGPYGVNDEAAELAFYRAREETMTADWVDVQITAELDAGEVLGLLDDSCLAGAWQDGRTIHLYWPSHHWTSDHLARVRRTLGRLLEPGAAEPDIAVHSLADQDWNRQWAQSVKPFRVGKRLIIRPSAEQVSVGPGEIEIVLDPKQAFGTGHHATTSLLLEWLEDDIRGGESVLDVGTGSGLLAMVALRFGAARALGIDDDADAIECAREYAAGNSFGPELTLACGTLTADFSSYRSYDIVLANLDRRTLLELAHPLAASTGRTLLVSGLLAEQRSEIVAAFALTGLYPARQRQREGWLAMEFIHAQSCEGP
ncbi:MAG TPA: 50S ribosomal protein L11 methyltransferase [Nitrospira sp.]|nr:50S ribosomal protein L11 methyltransferase [Nitrospira sp.]